MRVDHDLTGNALLPHVRPGVATAPSAVTFWTLKLSELSSLVETLMKIVDGTVVIFCCMITA